MELSINERAATFIGFVPETCDIELDCPQRVCYRCKRTHRTAPDMSQPEQWVKALEATKDIYRIERCYEKWAIYSMQRTDGLAIACEPTIGAGMVIALAALHDAEAGDAR